ncbi:hypothetical protein AA073_21785 [Salmonella enterica subsp. enterica serovar Newport]|nr:hypothetical protein [Salmonella enterica subsp. enterica serovar Newport]
MTTQLAFNSHSLDAIEHDGNIWFTASTLATALEYSRSDKVTQIYSRNEDEFTSGMTAIIETLNLRFSVKSTSYGNLKTRTRIFSLRGAHLIAMFANTPVAKQFRRWVLDLIDQESEIHIHPVATPRRTAEPLTRSDMKNLNHLVVLMTRQFARTGSWRLGVWHALRRATGVPSPEEFTVDDLPALTQECRRIIQITSEAGEMISRIERETVRRIVRHREDCDRVLAELQREWNAQRLDNASMRKLERYEQIALRKLENRVMA